MALFNKTNTKDSKVKKEAAKESEKKTVSAQEEKKADDKGVKINDVRISDMIISPRITEKTVKLMDKSVYTFNVHKDLNKTEIKKAIKSIYKVEPLKVNIINSPSKTKRNPKTGKLGKKSAFKKVLVYLKEGDKINII